jgi:histidinol-phosphate aminotransferase
MNSKLNRRDLFKLSGGAALGLAIGRAGLQSGIAVAADQDSGGVISLSGNENPYGPSLAAREAANAAQQNLNRYAYSAQLDFVKVIAEKEGVSPDHIVLGAGSSEVLCASGLAFCGAGRDTVAAEPGFVMVGTYAATVGGDVSWVPLDDEKRHDLDAMHQRVTANTGMVYVCNPNNPTGTLVDGDALRDFCTSLPKDVTVLVDEAYLEYSDNFDELTMLDLVKGGHNVVVARTFSKIHGLAGARIGYVIARPDLAARITENKMCKFQGPIAVAAARASLTDTDFQDFCRARVREGRQLVQGLCNDLGLDYTDAVGNFSFIDPKMSNAEFKKRMMAHGLEAARAFPPMPDWARITIGTTEEMQAFAEALPKIVSG